MPEELKEGKKKRSWFLLPRNRSQRSQWSQRQQQKWKEEEKVDVRDGI
ncbi:MAG: hypothetical protein ACI8RD_007348 [Bacillariaceae sp.]|jgi:hypothetical protein